MKSNFSFSLMTNHEDTNRRRRYITNVMKDWDPCRCSHYSSHHSQHGFSSALSLCASVFWIKRNWNFQPRWRGAVARVGACPSSWAAILGSHVLGAFALVEHSQSPNVSDRRRTFFSNREPPAGMAIIYPVSSVRSSLCFQCQGYI